MAVLADASFERPRGQGTQPAAGTNPPDRQHQPMLPSPWPAAAWQGRWLWGRAGGMRVWAVTRHVHTCVGMWGCLCVCACACVCVHRGQGVAKCLGQFPAKPGRNRAGREVT